jgi:hypothetical protein
MVKKDIVIGNLKNWRKKFSMEKKIFTLAKQNIGKTINISYIFIYFLKKIKKK